jgi:hypothetical protein
VFMVKLAFRKVCRNQAFYPHNIKTTEGGQYPWDS